jgi:hypothetical protein
MYRLGIECSTLDSYADFGSYKGSGRGWIDFICQEHLKFLHHSHQVTNIIIETAGARAGSESYVTATLRSREGTKVLQRQFWARYVDEWSRRDGLWAIDKRECVIDFDSVSEVTSNQRIQLAADATRATRLTACCRRCSDGHRNLVLIARKVEALEIVAANVRARTGVQVRVLALDLTDAAMLGRIREATDDVRTGPTMPKTWRVSLTPFEESLPDHRETCSAAYPCP